MGDTTPLDFLKLMVNDEMVESIVRETNRYATQTLKTKQLSPKSCFRHWVHFTMLEMWAFLGLIIGMGLIVCDGEGQILSDSVLSPSCKYRGATIMR